MYAFSLNVFLYNQSISTNLCCNLWNSWDLICIPIGQVHCLEHQNPHQCITQQLLKPTNCLPDLQILAYIWAHQMEEVLDRLEGPPKASVVKILRERLNRVDVVCMMMMESFTFELVFFSTIMPEFPSGWTPDGLQRTPGGFLLFIHHFFQFFLWWVPSKISAQSPSGLQAHHLDCMGSISLHSQPARLHMESSKSLQLLFIYYCYY